MPVRGRIVADAGCRTRSSDNRRRVYVFRACVTGARIAKVFGTITGDLHLVWKSWLLGAQPYPPNPDRSLLLVTSLSCSRSDLCGLRSIVPATGCWPLMLMFPACIGM
jgi:hypothetical protein